jgi:hypothetical protein
MYVYRECTEFFNVYQGSGKTLGEQDGTFAVTTEILDSTPESEYETVTPSEFSSTPANYKKITFNKDNKQYYGVMLLDDTERKIEGTDNGVVETLNCQFLNYDSDIESSLQSNDWKKCKEKFDGITCESLIGKTDAKMTQIEKAKGIECTTCESLANKELNSMSFVEGKKYAKCSVDELSFCKFFTDDGDLIKNYASKISRCNANYKKLKSFTDTTTCAPFEKMIINNEPLNLELTNETFDSQAISNKYNACVSIYDDIKEKFNTFETENAKAFDMNAACDKKLQRITPKTFLKTAPQSDEFSSYTSKKLRELGNKYIDKYSKGHCLLKRERIKDEGTMYKNSSFYLNSKKMFTRSRYDKHNQFWYDDGNMYLDEEGEKCLSDTLKIKSCSLVDNKWKIEKPKKDDDRKKICYGDDSKCIRSLSRTLKEYDDSDAFLWKEMNFKRAR